MKNTIQLNGTTMPLTDETVAQLIEAVQPPSPFAVAVNTIFVPKGQYHETSLKAGDVVDIVNPIVGG